MDDLNWLAGLRFQAAVRHEYTWDFVFDAGVVVVAECLWRLIEGGRIRVTSKDDGHKFGLPAPIDVVFEVNQRLAKLMVKSIELRGGTLDLEIRFDTGHAIQLIPDSSGYEAWNICDSSRKYVAVGGGDLANWGTKTNGS